MAQTQILMLYPDAFCEQNVTVGSPGRGFAPDPAGVAFSCPQLSAVP